MKNFVLCIALMALLCPCVTLAQNEANTWYFGGNAGIDFNPAVPVPLTNGALNTLEGCATISDKTTGQLLFYTNGEKIYNRNHVVMLNGDSLMGHHSTTQAAVIVPQPGSNRFYYVVTLDQFGGPNGYRYSIVDMNLDAGLGGVTASKNQFLQGPGTEKLTVTCHGNGTDYWILTHGMPNNEFYAYQVSASGIHLSPVVSAVGSVHGVNPYSLPGEMEVSPDGTRIAVATSAGGVLEVFDFDNLTGMLSNPLSLPAVGNEYGCAFSPDGSKLYYSSVNTPPFDVVQFDLNAGNAQDIAASRYVVMQDSIGVQTATLKNGPDGHLYVSRSGMFSLDVITQPNNPANFCGYVKGGFYLGGGYAMGGLPNNINCMMSTPLALHVNALHAAFTTDLEVDLQWEVANDGAPLPAGSFSEVERSADGAYFYAIGTVPHGPDSRHTFRDRNPLAATNFYRIKTRDVNGDLAFSRVVQVTPALPRDLQVQLSPNPARSQTQLSFQVQSDVPRAWEVKIFSLAGREILTQPLGELAVGPQVVALPVDQLEAGIYLLALQGGSHKEMVRLQVAN